jgi:3-methyladenine DNA glycosylase AlkD
MDDCRHQSVLQEFLSLQDRKTAEHAAGFFKTGSGEYGEGDCFLGVRVPVTRKMVKKWRCLSLDELKPLLHSEFHEVRLFALISLVERFEKASQKNKKQFVACFLNNLDHVNNWDLVDSSAYKILGPWLETRDRSILYELVDSQDMWRRRVAVISCLHFIRQNDFSDIFQICEQLLDDPEELIHKACGWMLREVGNRRKSAAIEFLTRHYRAMPRIMLRYAIEKFPEDERQAYLKGQI